MKFETQEALLEHMRAPVNQICPVADYEAPDDPEDGINEKVDEILAERKNDRRVVSWVELWRVLFPDDDEIPPSSMCSSLRTFDCCLLIATDFVHPKVVEIPEVINTIKSISIRDAFPTESGSEPSLLSDNGYSWHPQQATRLIAELETRLGDLCENEATASPRIVGDGSARSGTTEPPNFKNYTAMVSHNYGLSADLQGIGSQFLDSATLSRGSDDIQR